MKKRIICILTVAMLIVSGCTGEKAVSTDSTETTSTTSITSTASTEAEVSVSSENEPVTEENAENEGEKVMEKVTPMQSLKMTSNHNPVMSQKYSADPYAMEYDGRIYLYMTGDEPMYDAAGNIKKNDYSNINTIRVISSDDLVNWTDHGEVYAAGKKGAANWGNNSWAPAACWKMIDGKPKFFLYFANNGNGIAVLTSDSPTGPFVDPINGPLVSRQTPTCASVAWLFDPAVLVDDDGTGYLYFGGGIPTPDMASNPGTARVVRLTDDMIHLDCDPIPIENVLYLFEDSGINKVNDKYIYSYCSNFNVPGTGCEGYGFGSGEIITMVSDKPMGPFKTVGSVLKNPGYFFSYGGNNHHCMFEFKDQWYVTYHASLLEEKIGTNNGYRSVNIDKARINEDGLFAIMRGTKEGVEQVKSFDPFKENSFTTMANQAGIDKVPADEVTKKGGSGNFNLKVSEYGSWIELMGVDFKDGAKKLSVTLKAETEGSISLRYKYLTNNDLCRVVFDKSDDFVTVEAELTDPLTEVQNIFFVFEGTAELKSWSMK